MKKLTTKDIIILVSIAIVLYLLKAVLPLLIIIGLYLFIKNRNTPKIEQKPHRRPIEVEDTSSLDEYRATLAECEELISNEYQIRSETDLRQFKGRSDVTKEELADYMYEQRRWDGIYERHLQMEEIIKVCNLTEHDIEWVEGELKHYHPYRKENASVVYENKCCLVRDEEQKAIWEYYYEQDRIEVYKRINELKKWKQEREFDHHIGVDQYASYQKMVDYLAQERKKHLIKAINDLRRCDYESWLKLKGYVK